MDHYNSCDRRALWRQIIVQENHFFYTLNYKRSHYFFRNERPECYSRAYGYA